MKNLRIWILAVLIGASWLTAAFAPVAQAVMQPVENFAKVQLSTGYNSAATSVVVISGHGAKLPPTFPFTLVWWNATDYAAPEDDPFREIVSVTAKTSDTLTIVRAQEGTAASNHNTGGKTYLMIQTLTKAMWDSVRTDIASAGGASALLNSGTGTPEGAVTAGVGELYLRTDGSADTTLYRKQTGTGNTGWIAQPITTNWAVPGAIGATTPSPGTFTNLKFTRLTGTSFSPTYGTTVSIDALLGDEAVITVTNATGFTINNPTNGVAGDWLNIEVRNTSGGVMATPTWDTAYKMATFSKPQNGTRRSVTFRYNGTQWVEKACSPEVPNS